MRNLTSDFISRRAFTLALALALCLPASASAEGIKVLLFGDSLFANPYLPERFRMASVLETKLRSAGCSVQVIDASHGGRTSVQGAELAPRAFAGRPDLVVVEFGTNDLLRRVPLVEFRASMESIVLAARRVQAVVVLVVPTGPAAASEAERKDLQEAYQGLSKKLKIPLYSDIFRGLDRADMRDVTHPGQSGVEKIALRLSDMVTRVLPSPVRGGQTCGHARGTAP